MEDQRFQTNNWIAAFEIVTSEFQVVARSDGKEGHGRINRLKGIHLINKGDSARSDD